MRPVNKTIKNKILIIHAEWLENNGYKKEHKDCVKQIKSMKRTSVQVKPRASLCTATYKAVSNRGGVEPLLSWEYVHGNQES